MRTEKVKKIAFSDLKIDFKNDFFAGGKRKRGPKAWGQFALHLSLSFPHDKQGRHFIIVFFIFEIK